MIVNLFSHIAHTPQHDYPVKGITLDLRLKAWGKCNVDSFLGEEVNRPFTGFPFIGVNGPKDRRSKTILDLIYFLCNSLIHGRLSSTVIKKRHDYFFILFIKI